MNELLQERIRLGAAWLDENESGWRDRVQVIDLSLANACTCVLGQVFSADAKVLYDQAPNTLSEYGPTRFTETGTTYHAGYWYAIRERKLTDSEAVKLGFDHNPSSDYSWADMTVAWRGFLKGEWE